MMEKLKQKLNSQAGESIGETLVSLLIAALALVMLAGAVSASTGVIMKSRDKLENYYTANEEWFDKKMTSGDSSDTDNTTITITITDSSGNISDQSYAVTYYMNEGFGSKIVAAYDYSTDSADGSAGG